LRNNKIAYALFSFWEINEVLNIDTIIDIATYSCRILYGDKTLTDKKYESFKNNKIINEKVKEFITNIYNNKRNETLKIYELLCTDDEKALLEGY
jgi:hypothetical protein